MSASVWRPMRLDELGEVARGKSRHRPRNDPRLFGGPYPFIQTADIMAADPYIVSYGQTLSEFGLTQSRLWPSDTLCITIAGANTARTAILKFEACFPDSIIGFRPHPSRASLPFVKYSLDLMKHQFLAVTRGATQDNLSLDKLLSFPIPTPPLETQRRIASILSAYDDLIELNARRTAILEEIAGRLFDEWFVNFKFPGHQSTKLIDFKDQKIPKDWAWRPLSDIVEHIKQPTKLGSHLSFRRYVPIDCIGKRTLFLAEALDYSKGKSSLQLFNKNDILFGAMRAYFHKITVAPFDGITRSTCFVLRPKHPNQWAYVTFLMFHRDTVEYAAAHSKGATIPYASWNGSLANMPVLVPPRELIEKFGTLIHPIISFIQSMFFVQNTLRIARDLLLPRLISGEIDLSTAEQQVGPVPDQVAAE